MEQNQRDGGGRVARRLRLYPPHTAIVETEGQFCTGIICKKNKERKGIEEQMGGNDNTREKNGGYGRGARSLKIKEEEGREVKEW